MGHPEQSNFQQQERGDARLVIRAGPPAVPGQSQYTRVIRMSQSSRITLFFREITPTLLQNLTEQAIRLGLAVERWTSDSGKATLDGVTVRWHFTASMRRLEVECVRCPFWSNRRMVERNIRVFAEMLLRRSRAAGSSIGRPDTRPNLETAQVLLEL